MTDTLKILSMMGSPRRLFPFWIFGVVLLIWGGLPFGFAALAYGFLLQFFVEYGMHRFLYHGTPPKDQSAFNALYRSHIGHHEYPSDPEFFTGNDHWFPVRFGLISLGLHILMLGWFIGWMEAATLAYIALFVGSVSAFAFYEYCHTLAHLNVEKGWFGRRVTQSHMRHHFNDHETTFHVSFGMGWIDRLFGTGYDKAKAHRRFDRKTVLSVGMDPDDLRLVTARKAFGLSDRPRSET